MAEVVGTVIAEEVVRSCFQVIGRYISYTRKYKRNMESLKLELKKIEDITITILREIHTAENNAEDIRQDVLGWLQKCDMIKSKVDELFESTRPFNLSCLCFSCPNLKSRYLASSEASEITPLITQHLQEGKFDKVGQQPQLGQLPLLSPGGIHEFGSRMLIIKEIMGDLTNNSISIIGLCGMGGIGKTTLVKEIAEKMKNEKLIDEVAFAVVSQDESVKAIQDQLASGLGIKAIVTELDIQGRARLLYKRLMDEKKKILVILDDIWKELDLHAVGIPIHGDRKGFKILLTSRSGSVCADMKVQKALQIGILSKDEAWNLFKMTAEISDENIPDIAEEVSQECAGLPLAIVTVGKSLRNKKEHAFRDLLKKLRDTSRSNPSRIHNVLYSCIKSSYDFLESDEHSLILLLCSLFPEDYEIPVEDLVRYARGLFDSLESMAEARDRVEVIVDELLKCYLLLFAEKKKCVKLHDVVRDICLSIASKSGDVHISLKFDDVAKMLSRLKSQRPRLLRLVSREAFLKTGFFYGEPELGEIAKKELVFYEEMQELRVLEVINITTSLPSSLQSMINLHTLSLEYCRLEGDLAGIGSLEMLRVLSFFHSIVETFPTKIAERANLQCLDLRFHVKHPSTLPPGTLSSLKELEELYLGDNASNYIESLKEIRSLPKLHTIQSVVENGSCLIALLKNLNLLELIRFDIVQTESRFEEIPYQINENVFGLLGRNTKADLYLKKELMWRVKSFHLNGWGLTNILEVFGEDSGFPKLKELYLIFCDMKYLVDITKHVPKGVLSKLEMLDIDSASQLEELIHEDHQIGTLSSGLHEVHQGNLNVRYSFQCPLGNLRRLGISQCEKLKNLFFKSTVKCLRNLDQIDVYRCPILERIVASQKDEVQDYSEVSQFPTLRNISLNKLPGFRSLKPGSSLMVGFNQVMFPKLEDLTMEFCDIIEERGGEVEKEEVCFYLGCSLPKIRYLNIRECNNLFTVAKSGLVHGFEELENLKLFDCLSLEVVFDLEEIMVHISAEAEETTLLGRLEWLELDSLPKLKHICRMLSGGTSFFGNLKKIQVSRCGSLRYLLTPTVTSMLVHLEAMDLSENELLEEIIGRNEIRRPNDRGEFLVGSLVLPKLKSLVVRDVPSFKKLCCCSPELALELPSLSELVVTFMMEDIFTRDQLSSLTTFSIGRIGDRRYPFSPSSIELVTCVQELQLFDDELMEAIIGSDIHDGIDSAEKAIAFSKLRKLKIVGLPNFRNLCFSADLNLQLPSLVELEMTLCSVDILARETHALQNLTKVTVESCDNFKHLLSSSVKFLVHLEELVLRENQLMEAIFEPESSDGEEIPNKTIMLPKLRILEIAGPPKFKMISCSLNVNVELPSLTQLCIKSCPNMIKLCAGQLIAPQLNTVRYGYRKTEVALETFTNSWFKENESETRCLSCSFYQQGTCSHFDNQNAEAENNADATNIS